MTSARLARLLPQDHRAACYPDAFKIDSIAGGVRLSLCAGVFPGWISLPNLLANAHAQASARGGRLEIAGSKFLRTSAQVHLRDVGAIKIVQKDTGADVYLTARPRRKT